MPNRYQDLGGLTFFFERTKLFSALRDKLKSGYTSFDLRSDLLAGSIVALIAVPIGMALAVASGVAPQYGLYTVIIAGAIVALFGGSKFQVTGPTAAFVVILAPIVEKIGFAGLLIAGFMAGVLLVIMGLMRMGQYIRYIPYPVTTGFTTGIALVIASIQLKDFLGLTLSDNPDHFFERVYSLIFARTAWSPIEFAIGIVTFGILVFWPKINHRIPAPLIALTFGGLVVVTLQTFFPLIDIATIGSRFTDIPSMLPQFLLPWNMSGPEGKPFYFHFHTLEELIPSAFAIAMLGAIESLLSAVIADGMTQTKHDPDAELVALGIGNMVCPFFGGIAATGAIARTATNIRFGAKSPLASIFHAVIALVILLVFAPYLSYLPMASLAALLLLIAYNMSETRHFMHIVRVAPKGDVLILLLCFGLTITFDMVIAVSAGVIVAALLFMRRMASMTSGQFFDLPMHPQANGELPKDVVLYEIVGPVFFGAAERAVEALEEITDDARAVIFLLEDVPVMDMTGLVAFESTIDKLLRRNKGVLLVGLKPEVEDLMRKAGLFARSDKIYVCQNVNEALTILAKPSA